ncbi:Crossover junction endonuclease mus81 [Tulasnella sp. 419]|nr:Crossover junction endonuclease mus81 [Tulasnella sp. 419]
MPRRTYCVNQEYYDCAKSILDGIDKETNDNRYKSWNRAVNSLKAWPEILNSPAELKTVKHWGPKLTSDFTKEWNRRANGTIDVADLPGPSSRAKASTSKSAATRGKGKKRALPEPDSDLEDFSADIHQLGHSSSPPPPAKRRVANNRSYPVIAGGGTDLSHWDLPEEDFVPHSFGSFQNSALPQASYSATTDYHNLNGFEFMYVGENLERFSAATAATVSVSLEAGQALFLIEYLQHHQQHPWRLKYVQDPHTREDRFFGYITQSLAEHYHHRPNFTTEARVPPVQPRIQPNQPGAVPRNQRGSSNGGPSNAVLQREMALNTKKKTMGSIDPSRQATPAVQAALEALQRNGSTSRQPSRSASLHRSSSPATEASDDFPAIQKRVNRDDLARAALARQAASKISSVGQLPIGSSPAMSQKSAIDQRGSSPASSLFSSPAVPPRKNPVAAPPLYRSNTIVDDVFQAPRQGPPGLHRTATAPAGSSTSRIRRQTNHVPPPRALDELEQELQRGQPGASNSSPLRDNSSGPIEEDDDTRKLQSSVIFNPHRQLDPVETSFAPIEWPANSYQIQLIFDNRERAMMESGKKIIKGLVDNGVPIESRALNVGDAIWVAKLKPEWTDFDGQGVNGPNEWFKVVETKNVKMTIDWFKMMHKTIESLLRGQTLYIIPTEKIRRYSYLNLQKALRSQDDPNPSTYLTSFNDFQTLNSKSGSYTLRKCFAKMLLSINGMSAEKVGRLLESYDTPKALYESFILAEEEEEQQRIQVEGTGTGKGRKKKPQIKEAKHMLCAIEGTGRRKIGPALSEKVYHLFRSEAYDG